VDGAVGFAILLQDIPGVIVHGHVDCTCVAR
jgi:hypothetical protein